MSQECKTHHISNYQCAAETNRSRRGRDRGRRSTHKKPPSSTANATSYLKQPTFRSESRHAQANNLGPTTVRTELSQALNNSKRCRLTSYWEMQPRVAPCSCSAGRHHVGSRHPCASLPQHTPEQHRAASLVTAMQGSSYLQIEVCTSRHCVSAGKDTLEVAHWPCLQRCKSIPLEANYFQE